MPGADVALRALQRFDLENAAVSVWAFKKSASRANRFRAFALTTTQQLQNELKGLVSKSVERCTEAEDYSLIATINESSCLYLESDETIFSSLEELVGQPPEEHFIDNVAQLEGSAGYLVRWESGNSVLHCVCRLANDWSVKKRANAIDLVLRRHQLDLAPNEAFSIPKRYDFFVMDSSILVVNKSAFESLLEYKQTYVSSFEELQADEAFSDAFTDLAPLAEFVGTNTMHLRRMAIVQERGYYSDPAYMRKLRQIAELRNWGIDFDADGKLIPSAESARAIIQVLLNHRLHSELTDDDFDVASASPVA
ncbi:MAG: DUF4868 domain-containing protein [Pseudomonas sp.]|uniref:Kiwa anti-phage protein KwaB-like domain-containing protein n=1 Tax=Pseudomonas sp. TaxID=306 RepID=UPI002FC9F30E